MKSKNEFPREDDNDRALYHARNAVRTLIVLAVLFTLLCLAMHL